MDKIIEKLGYLGLDEVEAKIYLALLSYKSITVGKLAAAMNIDRSSLYRTAKKMINLGLANTTFSNPIVYSATDPNEAIPKIIQRREEEMAALRKIAQELIFDLDQRTQKETAKPNSTFNIVQGREVIYDKIADLIDSANNPIYFMTTIEDIMKMNYTSIPDKITEKVRNGIDVKVLTYAESENLYPFIESLHPSEIRLGALPSKSRIIVEKDSQVIMSDDLKENTTMKGKSESTLYTDSFALVTNMYRLCDYLWKKSKPLEMNISQSKRKKKSK